MCAKHESSAPPQGPRPDLRLPGKARSRRFDDIRAQTRPFGCTSESRTFPPCLILFPGWFLNEEAGSFTLENFEQVFF